MSKTVKIEIDPFDPSSIDRAIKQVDDFKKKTEKQLDELCHKLAEFGVWRAFTIYENAWYAGDNDVDVELEERDDHVCAVVATGHAVMFIEFGSGIMYPDISGESRSDLNISLAGRGHYGYGLGGKRGGWRYRGSPGNLGEVITEGEHAGEIHTYGNPAAHAMWTSREEMIQKIRKYAEEIFR